MMKKRLLAIIGTIVALAVVVPGGLMAVGANGPDNRVMTGTDFGQIRREALQRHPIGSKVAGVTSSLNELGFRCYQRARPAMMMSAPTVTCESNGRGGAASSRIALTLVARNDSLVDVSVSDGFDPMQASAKTPDPNPKGQLPRPAARPLVLDPEWNQILEAAAIKLRTAGHEPRLARNEAAVPPPTGAR